MHRSLQETIAGQLDAIAAQAEREIVAAALASTDARVRDDAAGLFRQLAMSNSWLEGRERLTQAWIAAAAQLAASEPLAGMIRAEQIRLRDTEAFAGITALCRRGQVDRARRELASRAKAASDPELQKRIEEVLAEPRNFLGPQPSAPTLLTVNGCGLMMHGRRNAKPDGTFVATLCLVFVFLPILPLRAYLVRHEGSGWRFLARVPLSPFAFWWQRIALVGPLLAILAGLAWSAWDSSPYVRETRLLSKAADQAERSDYAGAIDALASMHGSSDPARSARADSIASSCLTKSLSGVQEPADAELFLSTTGRAASQRSRPLSREASAAAEAALLRIAAKPDSGMGCRDLLHWMGSFSPELAARLPETAAEACSRCDSPVLLAATAEHFVNAGRACPPELLRRLQSHLERARHGSWDADVLSYLRAADPQDGRSLLHARAEAAWKGTASGTDLLDLKTLPEPLRRLLALDSVSSPEKQAEELEKAADPRALEEPQKTWHRLGSARRLSKVYGVLNEQDPIKYPLQKVRPWAILAAELAPEDAALRLTAMRYLLEEGDFARVIALGSAAKEDSHAATLVGIALARSGRADEAAALLRPIVSRDLPEYSSALQAWEKAYDQKTSMFYKSLDNGTAGRAILSRLDSLPDEQAKIEAGQWVRRQVEQDPQIAALARKWRDRRDVHPAAGELAMIELGLGRSIAPGPERQARLTAAEKLFLELRKILKDDPHQELQLGQVYLWLGKEKEGTEIFDRLESGDDPKILHELGQIYREFTRFEAARRVLEKAYNKASGSEKSEIAMTRALATFDSEDRLVWLRRCASSPRIQMDIDQTEAEQNLRVGNFEYAANALHSVARYYAGLSEDSTNLNNASIVQLRLAQATGESKHQLEALRFIRRAYELAPDDAIVLNNYIDDLRGIGYAALAGQALRMDLIHELPNGSWVDFVVPAPLPEEWAARAKAQPELRRAVELAGKAVILSPDSDAGYDTQRLHLELSRDSEGLRRLRESLEKNPPARHDDTSSEPSSSGDSSAKDRKSVERRLRRWEGLLPALRKAGHGPSLAYALIRISTIRLWSVRLKTSDQKLQTALKEAEEAVAAFDAAPTRRHLAWSRMEAAAMAVAAFDPEFDKWLKAHPGLSGSLLLPSYARKHPEALPKIRESAEVLQALESAVVLAGGGVRSATLSSWLWLEMFVQEGRQKALEALRSDPCFLEAHRVKRLLDPRSSDEVLRAWYAAIGCGEKDLAATIAADAQKAGVFEEFFKP
jgi:hypothetical protein